MNVIDNDAFDFPNDVTQDSKGRLKSAIGYATQQQARKAAKEFLGKKSKEGLMFVTGTNAQGQWEWVNIDTQTLKKELIANLSSKRQSAPV